MSCTWCGAPRGDEHRTGCDRQGEPPCRECGELPEDCSCQRICGTCNGSGEGRYDGAVCAVCGGSGEDSGSDDFDDEPRLWRED